MAIISCACFFGLDIQILLEIQMHCSVRRVNTKLLVDSSSL